MFPQNGFHSKTLTKQTEFFFRIDEPLQPFNPGRFPDALSVLKKTVCKVATSIALIVCFAGIARAAVVMDDAFANLSPGEPLFGTVGTPGIDGWCAQPDCPSDAMISRMIDGTRIISVNRTPCVFARKAFDTRYAPKPSDMTVFMRIRCQITNQPMKFGLDKQGQDLSSRGRADVQFEISPVSEHSLQFYISNCGTGARDWKSCEVPYVAGHLYELRFMIKYDGVAALEYRDSGAADWEVATFSENDGESIYDKIEVNIGRLALDFCGVFFRGSYAGGLARISVDSDK